MLNLLSRIKIFYRAWRYRLRLDRKEIAFVLSNVRKRGLVVDIGAHKGAYSYWLRKGVGPDGQVIAFEPQPGLARYLENTVNDLGWENVVIENSGVSSKPGVLSLNVPGGNCSPGASFCEKEGDGYSRIQVAVESLDEYLGKHRPGQVVQFIKCDVEGYELEVFRGAKTVLAKDKPILLFECEIRHLGSYEKMLEIFQFLKERGYHGFFFTDKELLPIEKFVPEKHQKWGSVDYFNNFVFIDQSQETKVKLT